MMDDRELLERAARAAGWDGWRSKHGYWNLTNPEGEKHSCCHNWLTFDPNTGDKQLEPTFADALIEAGWAPLEDDGDALRLAVKLGIAIQLHPAWVYARAVMPGDHFKWMEITEGWGHTKDPYAATRRAIVRAAASLAEGEAK